MTRRFVRRTAGGDGPGRFRRGLVGSALLGALLVLGSGCEGRAVGGLGELNETMRLTVRILNVGQGQGDIDVEFSQIDPNEVEIEDPCVETLGPGESCSPSVDWFFQIEEVTVTATPAPGSEFAGWSGVDCLEEAEETRVCVIQNEAQVDDHTIFVDVDFGIAPEADGGS